MRRWPTMSLLCTLIVAPVAPVAPVASVASVVTSTSSATASDPHTALVRVNQVGYDSDGSKPAYVLADRDVEGHAFRVVDEAGATVLTGEAGPSAGEWNDSYPYVSPVDLSGLTRPGTYKVRLDDPPAQSPPFRVGSRTDLYTPLLTNARAFFEVQRDGPDVIAAVLDRQPAHLNDRTATVYAPPSYRRYELTKDLKQVGGPVDVSGGWFDAGDYLKFVQTTSYADTLLLMSRRDTPELLGPGAAADLTAEIRFGTDWLQQMWDDDTRTLLYQVGIGDGNGCGSICGDHDLWRLPEVDDTYQPAKDKWRYIRERPALRAGPPGARVSPNLAGRLAAAFALCSQVFRDLDPAYADSCLRSGQHVYDLADTTSPKLLSGSPNGYYPEDSWRDDLELGATELARATLAAGPTADEDASRYLREAASWAEDNLRRDAGDTLNLYDVSGLAHAELHRAIVEAGEPGGLDVSLADLRGGIRDQVQRGVRQAGRDPFGVGVKYGYDVASHLFGLVILAREYDSLSGDSTYADFATEQLGALFGANAWGTSFVVGAGTVFPACMQHQVSNLSGTLDGTAPLALGAVVNGPNRPNQVRHLGLPDGARACPPGGLDPYGQFTGHGGRYLDDVTSWPTVEPAIDFTATSMLALASSAAGVPRGGHAE